ncbi:hypothetical protein [Iodobacter ciconiae]|nr:hypothetical protein [Iodobacter ciconiae]
MTAPYPCLVWSLCPYPADAATFTPARGAPPVSLVLGIEPLPMYRPWG